ncbi:hypothetical protein GOBAR_DD32149 [Gossypium barbadense]|nr:hypothetical protein GOBAR_DD32149 [Gossypium barbadense]
MELMVMVKFLGRNIEYTTLHNRCAEDFDKVLYWGPWIVYGHLLSLPIHLDKKKNPWGNRGLIGRVAKLDLNIVRVNGEIQQSQGEKEPTAVSSVPNADKSNEEVFSLWMQFQKKSRHILRDNQNQNMNNVWKVKPGSRLLTLIGLNENEGEGGEITMVGSNGVKKSLGFVLGDNQGNMKGVKGESSSPITGEDASVSDFKP